MRIISFLKKLPVDVGQSERKHTTAGKRIAFSLVQEGEGREALDVGCRDGYWSDRLKERGFRVASLDIEPNYPGAIRHDANALLPFPDRTFDLIWCTEVIEHLHDPHFLMREIERLIRPGGRVIVTTPNSHWWFYGMVRLWGWTPERLQNKDHKHFFSEESIRHVARGYDLLGYFPYMIKFFRIRRLVGLLSPTFILTRLF